MATTIEQLPLYRVNPATFKWIYVFKNDAIVSGNPTPYWNVKFVGGCFIGVDLASLGSMNNLVATTKTVPNNAGVGIFNIQVFCETYTAAQQLNYYSVARNVKFKGQSSTEDFYFPIHVIDKYSQNDEACRYVDFRANLEGALQSNLPAQFISGTNASEDPIMIFNGYKQNDFFLRKEGNNFGYDYETYYAPKGPGSYGILSDAPLVQYAYWDDYGVISFFNQIFSNLTAVAGVTIVGTMADGTTDTFTVNNVDANGGVTTPNPGAAYTTESILYFGVFPANLYQSNSTFAGWINSANPLVSYTFHIQKSGAKLSSKVHTIILNCDPPGRRYKNVRIAWLNSMGGWDYYSFRMKSSETLKTKRNDWQQLEGSWNKDSWNPQGWKGGKKAYTVNATKKHKVNTPYINDEESKWFEFMINSPQHYIIYPYEEWREPGVDKYNSFEKYVRAVKLTSSSYKKKTRMNDSVIQYSFEFEESRSMNTQPA